MIEKGKIIELNNKINLMKLFGNFFNFITILFKLIIMKYQRQISEKSNEELDKKTNESFSKLLNII